MLIIIKYINKKCINVIYYDMHFMIDIIYDTYNTHNRRTCQTHIMFYQFIYARVILKRMLGVGKH